MFEQTFKNIDDILHKDAGCSSELDYVEQTSWILFLKYLDDFEKDKKTAAELSGKEYTPIIETQYRWDKWAMPKGKDAKLDHHKGLTGDDLKDFVDHKLFPYLKKFKTDADSPDTIVYKIGEIFSELKNKIQSGYNVREVINLIDEPGGVFTGAGVKTVVLSLRRANRQRRSGITSLILTGILVKQIR